MFSVVCACLLFTGDGSPCHYCLYCNCSVKGYMGLPYPHWDPPCRDFPTPYPHRDPPHRTSWPWPLPPHPHGSPLYSDIPPLSHVQTCSLCRPYFGKWAVGIRLKCLLISSHVEEFICSFLFKKIDSRYVPWMSSTILSSEEPLRNALLILRESLSLQYS